MTLGSRYKLLRHPSHPVGRVIDVDTSIGEVLIEWDDHTLIPPRDYYPYESFMDGTFLPVQEENCPLLAGCFHVSKRYVGLREVYDYCEICGEKL